jgi:hypothetical protein
MLEKIVCVCLDLSFWSGKRKPRTEDLNLEMSELPAPFQADLSFETDEASDPSKDNIEDGSRMTARGKILSIRAGFTNSSIASSLRPETVIPPLYIRGLKIRQLSIF